MRIASFLLPSYEDRLPFYLRFSSFTTFTLELTTAWFPTYCKIFSLTNKFQVYLCKKLRISCLAAPSSSHAFLIFTLSFSTLLLNSCPFSLRHRSIVCFISIPTAWRVPSSASPFLATGPLRPCPVLTWKSSKATLRFSVMCAAATGWSKLKGQQILRKEGGGIKYRDQEIKKKPYKGIPLPRDSVTLLKPPCVINHPVAYENILNTKHSDPGQVKKMKKRYNTGWFKINCCGDHVVGIPRPDNFILSACCSDILARGDERARIWSSIYIVGFES